MALRPKRAEVGTAVLVVLATVLVGAVMAWPHSSSAGPPSGSKPAAVPPSGSSTAGPPSPSSVAASPGPGPSGAARPEPSQHTAPTDGGPPIDVHPVGVDVDLFGQALVPLEQQFRLMKAGGLSAVRQDFPWAQIEPARSTFDWTAADTFMAAASSVGIGTLVTLDYSTSWASTGPATNQFSPPDDSDFAAFAAAVAERYGPDGSFWSTHPHTSQPLQYLEVWNEPWSDLYWQPEPDPERYVQLAHAVADAVHPLGVKVLISGDLLETRADHQVLPWLADILTADPTIATWVDGFSVHPYPAPGDLGPASPVPDPRFGFQRLALIRRELDDHGGAATPIWVTEIGWSTAGFVGQSVSEQEAGAYLVQSVRLAFGTYGVAGVFVFTWQDPSTLSSSAAGYGLRRSDGSFKPGWHDLEGLLGGAGFRPG